MRGIAFALRCTAAPLVVGARTPWEGFEPSTYRLTAGRSTTELPGQTFTKV